MSAIDISTPKTILNTGVLQLQNGVAMDSTLRNVADQSNTISPLKLSTASVQVTSTLQITTNDDPYIDAEDGAGNNRFTIGRASSSQQVNVDFASNPTASTETVGAIRTYKDGVNLSEVMSFRKNGTIGIGTNSPTAKLQIIGSGSTSATTSLLVQNSGGLGNFQILDNGAVSVINEGNFSVNRYGNTLLSTGQITSTLATYNSQVIVTNTGVSFTTLGNFGWQFLQDLFQGYHPMIIQDATFKARASSAILELNSKTKGFLPPVMTTAQKNAIATPAAGLMVYDTTLNKLCVYTTAWETITSV